MRGEDLVLEIDKEIEQDKKEQAKLILKAQRKRVDALKDQADKAEEKYEEMLEMYVDDLIEKYGDKRGGIVNFTFYNPTITYST